jgi:hypothetical protein
MARLSCCDPGVISIALVGVFGCAPLVESSAGGALAAAGRSATGYRIAVAPVTLAPELEGRAAAAPGTYAEASIHVGHYLAEALQERGFEVMPARGSEATLAELARSSDLHHDASKLARFAVERLGVDALLLIELARWTPRGARAPAPPTPSPEAASSSSGEPLLPDAASWSGSPPPVPAAVGFRATLHGGSDGLLLWSGEFSQRQASFFEAPWRSLRYPGRGTRWLSVTELARWGARQLAAEIPRSPDTVEYQ